MPHHTSCYLSYFYSSLSINDGGNGGGAFQSAISLKQLNPLIHRHGKNAIKNPTTSKQPKADYSDMCVTFAYF